MLNKVPRLFPGPQWVDGDAWNGLLAEVERLSNLEAVPPLEYRQEATGYHLRLDVTQALGGQGQVVNENDSTHNLDAVTYNYLTNSSSGGGVNYGSADNVVYNLSAYDVWQVKGPGYFQSNAPFLVAGYQFWNCYTYSFSSAAVNNWVLPAAATVFDLTANSGGTTITGIKPQAFGAPVNTGAVTNATNASPIVLTVPGWTTQPAVGQAVVVSGVNGNTAANGTWTAQASTATTLTLQNTTGNGAFAASPGSTVQLVGSQLIVLNNVYTATLTLNALSASSDPANQIILPPTYGGAVTLAHNDSAILWWDECASYAWRLIACTVAGAGTGGVQGEHNTASPTGSHPIVNFIDSASVTWTVANNAGNNSVDLTATAAGGTTGTNGEGPFSGIPQSLTTSFANISGLTVTLPTIGKYLLIASVGFGTSPASNASVVQLNAKMVDATVGGNLTHGGTAVVLNIPSGMGAVTLGASVACIITTTQTNEIINVQGSYTLVSGTAPALSVNGGVLDYVKLS